MSTTINRRPYSVDLPTSNQVKNYYFNQNKFKGLIEDKNFLETDPTSFSDCSNVYVDPDGVFKSRPSLDIYKSNFFHNNNEKILDVYNYKVGDFTYQDLATDSQAKENYLSSLKEIWVIIVENTQTGKFAVRIGPDSTGGAYNTVDFNSKPIVVKTNNTLYAFASTTSQGSVFALSLRYIDSKYVFGWTSAPVYVPITEIVKGTAKVQAESPNTLTGSYRTRYLFDTVNSTQYDDFVGKNVDITVAGEHYYNEGQIWYAGQEQFITRQITPYYANYEISADELYELTGLASGAIFYPTILANTNLYARYKITDYRNVILSSTKKIKTYDMYVETSYDGSSFSTPITITNCIALPVIIDDGLLVPILYDDSDSMSYAGYKICKLTANGITNYSAVHYLTVSVQDSSEDFIYGNHLLGFDALNENTYLLIYSCYRRTLSNSNVVDIRMAQSYSGTLNNMSVELYEHETADLSDEQYCSTILCKCRLIENELKYACLSIYKDHDGYRKTMFRYMKINPASLSTFSFNEQYAFKVSNINELVYLKYDAYYLGMANSLSYTLFTISDKILQNEYHSDALYYLTIDDAVNKNYYDISITSGVYENFAVLDSKYNYVDVPKIIGSSVVRILSDLDADDHTGNTEILYNIYPLFEISNMRIISATEDLIAFAADTLQYDTYIYANTFNQYNLIVIDTTTEGDLTEFNPDHYSYLSEHYFSEGNILYVSSTGLQPTKYEIEDIEGSIEHNDFEWYLPKMLTNEFDNDITYLHPISATEMAVFFEREIYYTTFDTQNSVYRAYKTMHQVGLVEGGEVITTFDTKYVIFSSQRGFVAMSYQEFMATTEQSLNFLSDTIHDLYKAFNMTPVKLYKYDYWIVAYHENFNGAMLFDLRNNSWWPWEIPYDIVKLFSYLDQDLEKGETTIPIILTENSLYKLNRSELNYTDEGSVIHWFFTSQRLPFALNYYKHIQSLTFISLYDVEKLREHGWSDYRIGLKLRTLIYRTSVTNGELAPTPIYYDIDFVRTYVQRLNYSKVEEFQYQLESDDTNAHPLPLSITNMSIKYKIGSQVR